MKLISVSTLLVAAAITLGFASAPRGGASVGQEAPDFEIAEWRNFPEGASTLADLRGRVVLLDFWRTW
jgi:hypothetical protein